MPHSASPLTYLADRMGTATVTPTGEFEAGSFASFTLTYTAGYFGIDDTGGIKIVHRFASDMGRPQFTDPSAPNYTTVESTNGAVLSVEFDAKRNLRPWDKALVVKVQRGFLRAGDQIIVRLGDPRQGSPGIRVQTFHEPSFEFKFLVDAFATYNFVELPVQPVIAVVGGPAVLYKAILPTVRRVGQPFTLGFKGEDRWGNPSPRVDATFRLRANLPVHGLPDTFTLRPGDYARAFKGLSVARSGELIIEVMDEAGRIVCAANPLRIVRETALLPFWGDLHGQSEETIGTNSARELIEFARDRAFLDVMSHQGNDFQITTDFWHELNQLTAEYNRDHEFVIFPGYEWSGNTGLGGDRNVMFMQEGRQIHRSHHALVADLSDVETDANSAEDLFEALKYEDCIVFAHIGGRYADIKMAQTARANPDGYTMAVISQGTQVFNLGLYPKLDYDPLKDFVPITPVAYVSNVMILNPGNPARSVQDVIAAAKARPGELTFSSGGNGTSHHMSGVLFGLMTATDLLHVPYRGAPQGISAVMQGEVTMGFFNTPTVISQIRDGKLRALAVTSLQRSPHLPDVPTLDAAGVKGYEVVTWMGLAAPAGTPPAIVGRWRDAVAQLVQQPALRDKMIALGFDPMDQLSPSAFATFIRADIDKWVPIVKASGATAE